MNFLLSIQSFLVSRLKIVKVIVCLMYLAGFLGMTFEPTKFVFLLLTAFNLWVSTILLLFFHEQWDRKVVLLMLIVAIGGFLIEVIGVKTGKIFGIYYYGETLGFKLWEVPISIGINWLMLTYLLVYFVQKTFKTYFSNQFVLAIICSFFMVFLDYFIEPVAINFNFWQWNNNQVPLQNYMGWFVISFVFSFLFLAQKIINKNNIAQILLMNQALFFMCHNLVFSIIL